MNGSRSSSCTSGSYGHLSAGTYDYQNPIFRLQGIRNLICRCNVLACVTGTLSPVLSMHPTVPSAHLQQLQHLMRQGSIPSSPFLFHQSPGFSSQSLLMSPSQMPPNMLHPLGMSKLETSVSVLGSCFANTFLNLFFSSSKYNRHLEIYFSAG